MEQLLKKDWLFADYVSEDLVNAQESDFQMVGIGSKTRISFYCLAEV